MLTEPAVIGEGVGVRDRDAGVDGGCGIVLGVGERPGRVDQRRRVRDARDGDRHRGGGAAVEGVGEGVRGGAWRVVAVVEVGLVGEPGVGAGAAAGEHHGAVGRVAGRGDRHRAGVDVGVVGQHRDRSRRGVLDHGGGVGHRDRRVVAAGDGDRHCGDRAAVEGVGERVRGRAWRAVAVVGVGLVGEPGARPPVITTVPLAGRSSSDRHRAGVDVGVVGQHVDRGGSGVLGHGRRVVHGRRRVVDAGDGDRDRGGGAAVEGVGEGVRGGAGRVVAVVRRRAGR